MKEEKIPNGLLSPFSREALERIGTEVIAALEAQELVFKDGAKQAFNAYIKYPIDDPKLEASRDQMTGKIRIRNPAGEALDALIGNALNHRSMGYFVDLILEHHESARQAARAIKRHAENHAMKADVYVWLDANMQRFKSMDSAAEAISGKVAPIAFRTARDWVGEWKKLRSASKP